MLVEPGHAAAWHAWGMLEKREGNLVKARDIWIKVLLKDCTLREIPRSPWQY